MNRQPSAISHDALFAMAVNRIDPLTIGAVLATLIGVALIATSRRAARRASIRRARCNRSERIV